MSKKWAVILRRLGLALVAILGVALFPAICEILLNVYPGGNASTPVPRREYVTPQIVEPQMVVSTWNFETIFSPQKFELPSHRWLAVDSMGRPALAYGGSQLNFSWFDGTKWQSEGIDLRPGAGKFAHLLLDAADQPQIVYMTGALADLSLEIMYRDAQGWHHQTIDTKVCFGRNLDIALDLQGSPVIAYDASPSCTSSSMYTSQIRFARRGRDGWQIETISHNGMYPAIMVDRSGQVHISYQDTVVYSLIESILRPGGDWESETIAGLSSFPVTSSILIDSKQQTHIISGFEDSGAMVLNHFWRDETGWQSEKIETLSPQNLGFTAVIDLDDQISVLLTGDSLRLLRRDLGGWREIEPPKFGTGLYSAPTLAMDGKKQLHLAYFTFPQNSIFYAHQQGGQWKMDEVARSNVPGNAALAFDQAGQLHVSFFDGQRVLHYFSKEPAGWQDEVVSQRVSSLDPSIELLMDRDDLPHVFYQNDTTSVHGTTIHLVHAFRGNNGWMNEVVPVVQPEESAYRSRFAISPEGWPACVQSRYVRTYYLVRSSAGWETELLENIQSGVSLAPQIVFLNRVDLTSSNQSYILPVIFYFDYKANVLKYYNPGAVKPLVVPLLAQADQPASLAVLPSNQESPTLFAFYVSSSHNQPFEENLRFAVNQSKCWKTYQLNDVYLPDPFIPLVDSTGSIRLAYMDYNQPEQPLYYLSGSNADWKKSAVTGYDGHPYEISVLSTALGANGQFCLLLSDIRANSLVLGCLESMK